MPKKLIIFEGALCCSTGICGPEPDKILIRFNKDVKRLQAEFPQDSIMRASLSFNAAIFLEHSDVLAMVKEHGMGILPVTMLDGKILARQRYMSYPEMRSALTAEGG